jgi:P63C domain
MTKTPKATHQDKIKIGDLEIPCAVLDDEARTRVLSERGTTAALGGKRGGAHWRRQAEGGGAIGLPAVISANNLAPFVSDELRLKLGTPIRYTAMHGGRPAHGIEAKALPEICEVLLKARDAGPNVLTAPQKPIAANADILMRGLAHVGVIALVDEATGFQEERNRNELQQILEAYISKELLPWAKRFPDEYYEQLFRLRGWQYSPVSVKRPSYVGTLTNELIYDRMPPGVKEELQRTNPVNPATKRRRRKHHQFLTEDIGNPHLERQMAAVIALMRAAPTWAAFKRMFARAFPPPQMMLEIPDEDADADGDKR